MRTGLVAQKLGMSRVFREDGTHVPVTVLKVESCQVVAQRTQEKDGYVALQLGAGARKPIRTTQAMRGHFAKAQVEPKRKLVEFRVAADALIEVGAELTVDHFMPGDNVRVKVDLITPIAMDEGLRFAIREGGRTVGAGVVTKIFE